MVDDRSDLDSGVSGLRWRQDEGDILLFIKAVPGASRDEVAGRVGDRLKVRITAPPEGGRANKAIGTLIATTLGVKRRDVTIESGHGSAEKTIRIRGIDGAAITESL